MSSKLWWILIIIPNIADLCFDFSSLRKARWVVSSGIAVSPSVIICLEFQPFSRRTLTILLFKLANRICAVKSLKYCERSINELYGGHGKNWKLRLLTPWKISASVEIALKNVPLSFSLSLLIRVRKNKRKLENF